jgi:hypothetical protein
MRLTEREKTAIVGVVASFDPAAEVYLFVRARMTPKGAENIDLLIFSGRIDRKIRRAIRRAILEPHRGAEARHRRRLRPRRPMADPFVRLARSNAVRLS